MEQTLQAFCGGHITSVAAELHLLSAVKASFNQFRKRKKGLCKFSTSFDNKMAQCVFMFMLFKNRPMYPKLFCLHSL